MKIDEIAERIISELKKEGIVLHRYNSYSSKSVYIKLDYGVCNSIRISDHRGKKHLKYKYNVLTNNERGVYSTTEKGGLHRIYYGEDDIDTLIRHIKKHRQQKINRYGIGRYNYYKDKNFYESRFEKGFWTQAVEV